MRYNSDKGGEEMNKKEIKALSVRLPKDLVVKLDEEAKEKLRSRNQTIAFILEEYFKKTK